MASYHVAVLVWLFWILALVVGAILLVWALLIGAVVVGGVTSDELCPRCGLSLEITARDRFSHHHFDKRYRSNARNQCDKCGWRRTKR